MSTPNPDREGTFGRRPGVYAVPFKKQLLPGVTFVSACEALGETIAKLKGDVASRVRQPETEERHAAIDALVKAIAKNPDAVPGLPVKAIITGEEGYDAQTTARAILRAIKLLKENDNATQGERYTDRVRQECDRATGNGRAGANVIGWSDSRRGNKVALKRATDADIAAAIEARDARSGVNSPYSVYVSRREALFAEETEAREKGAKARVKAGRKAARAAANGEPVASEPADSIESASEAKRARKAAKVARKAAKAAKAARREAANGSPGSGSGTGSDAVDATPGKRTGSGSGTGSGTAARRPARRAAQTPITDRLNAEAGTVEAKPRRPRKGI